MRGGILLLQIHGWPGRGHRLGIKHPSLNFKQLPQHHGCRCTSKPSHISFFDNSGCLFSQFAQWFHIFYICTLDRVQDYLNTGMNKIFRIFFFWLFFLGLVNPLLCPKDLLRGYLQHYTTSWIFVFNQCWSVFITVYPWSVTFPTDPTPTSHGPLTSLLPGDWCEEVSL